MKSSKKPMVNVLITTYNLEDYIEQTLLSVLNQKTKYEFSIIILDDASTDNTIGVINKLINNHPKGHRIDLHKQKENKGVKQNTYDLFQFPTAPYIMFLDGDDWWVDEYKIEKQLKFLESNPDYNLVTGRHIKYIQASGKYIDVKDWVNIKKDLTLRDYLAYNFGQTSTLCYRNNYKPPIFFSKTIANDQLQVILSVQDKLIKYMPDILSVYRIHSKSNSHGFDHKKAYFDTKYFLDCVNEYTDYKYNKIIRNRLRINRIYYKWTTSSNSINKIINKIKLLSLRLYAYKFLAK